MAGQGFPARVLAQHHLKFEEGAIATLFPFGIALGFAALASLNQAGNEVGRILSLACQSIFLVGGGLGRPKQWTWRSHEVHQSFCGPGPSMALD